MTYRVQHRTVGDRVLFALSGELNGDHAATLQALLATESPARVQLDLSDVIVVDAETVRVLRSAESDGVTLVNCPEFVRTWIALESATHQTTSTTPQEEDHVEHSRTECGKGHGDDHLNREGDG